MFENILLFCWVAFLIFVSLWLIKKAKQGETLQFQAGRKPDVPYVTIKSQGMPLNMLVDTGCGSSIIDKNLLNVLEYEETDEHISLAALTSDSVSSKIVVIPITIKGKEFKQKFAPYVSNGDIANFRSLYGIALHGILGSDFLETTKCRIDFNKHAVILS